VILVEDGHQTRGVPRHCDVLILADWSVRRGAAGDELVPENGLVFPWGPYREPPRAAMAADIWLCESASPLPPGIRAPQGDGSRPRICAFARYAELPPDLSDAAAPVASLGPETRYATLSGIARPEAFERDCAELVGRAPAVAVRCDDHTVYTVPALRRIIEAGREAGVARWLTTEKDLIKLDPAAFPVPISAVRQKLCWHEKQTLPDLIEERLVQEDEGAV
jgi:tetraacyldisaccharide-1-P 4'-kinase